LRAGRSDRQPTVAAKVGDRLEFRHQAAGQPHRFNVALRFPLKPSARLGAIGVAVEVDFQQRRNVIGRPSRRLRRNARKAHRRQVNFLNVYIDG